LSRPTKEYDAVDGFGVVHLIPRIRHWGSAQEDDEEPNRVGDVGGDDDDADDEEADEA
jgi:hypothetical protein